MSTPKIAIVGRPNVGKSSLFNRIIGRRRAIIESASGTTRDRLHAQITRDGKRFIIVDTGGFDDRTRTDMAGLVLKQLMKAVEEADIIFFMTDGASGVLPQDLELSTMLRKQSKPIYLVVNKIDDKSQSDKALDFFELGLGEPYPVSAINGIGIEKLLSDVAAKILQEEIPAPSDRVKVAIVGRPNVGKSSYLNSLLKEESSIVHHEAGTTRDALDTAFEYKDKKYILIDTAGMRHNMKLKESADFYGSVRSEEAVRRCDAAIVLIDGFEALTEDDARIIRFVIEEGKALVVGVNKWDIVKGIGMDEYKNMLVKKLNLIRNYPVVFISCKTGRNVHASLEAVNNAHARSGVLLKPEELAEVRELLNDTPEVRNKRIKFTALVQKGRNPPEFFLKANNPRLVKDNLKRYVENFLREARDFEGAPIRVTFNEERRSAAKR